MLAKHSELINQHYKNSMIVSFFISRQIGRPKEFDEGEVLTGIMSASGKTSYEATALAQITKSRAGRQIAYLRPSPINMIC